MKRKKEHYTLRLHDSTFWHWIKECKPYVCGVLTCFIFLETMAVTECHPFVGSHYRATTHFACHIYIANTAGHITSPTSKAASWKAQRILAEIYNPHLYASETCWSEVISHPLPFCVSCVKLANALMTHFQNFYTCKDKPLQPSQPPVIKPNPLLLYTKWKSYNPLNQHLSHSLSKTDTSGEGGVIC